MNTELLDTLIAAWLDGTATEPQALALRDALTGSQAAAQRFAQMLYHEHSLQIALTPVAALTGAETETSDGISGSEQSHDPSAVAPARELAGLRDVAALPTQPTRPSRGPRHRRAPVQRRRPGASRWQTVVAGLAALALLAAAALLGRAYLMRPVETARGVSLPAEVAPSLPVSSIARVETVTIAQAPPAGSAPAPTLTALDGRSLPVTEQTVIPPGALLQSGAAELTVAFADDGTELTVAPGTTLRLNDGAAGKQVAMVTGQVHAAVAKQPPGHPMRFTSPQATAEVVGTHLAVRVDAAGTRLAVEEGAVRFFNRAGENVLVQTGSAEIVGPDDRMTAAPFIERRILASFDFETPPKDQFDSWWVKPPVVNPSGGTHCMQAQFGPKGDSLALHWSDYKHPLFKVASDQEISFDYLFVGRAPQWVNVTILDSSTGKAWAQDVPVGLPGQWKHVSVRLGDFKLNQPPQTPILAGTPINLVILQMPSDTGQKFFIDNLRFSEPAP